MESATPTHTKVIRARAQMIQSARFFGAIALRLTPKPTAKYPTLASDGVSLFYNPEWIETAPEKHVKGMCAKLAAHIALLHHTRRRGRDKSKWQKACDLAVNPLIQNAEFDLPETAAIDPTFAGKSAEEIYRLLPDDTNDDKGDGESEGEGGGNSGAQAPGEGDEGQEGEGGGDSPSPDPSGCGQILDASNPDGSAPSQAEREQIEADTQVAVMQANNLAKSAGQGHADIDRLVDNIQEARVDWHEELRRFMQQAAKSDYSMQRPNRRTIGQGVYLPSLRGKAIGEMVVALDESGSVLDWLEDFCSELSGIIEDVKPSKVWVLHADDRIAHVDELTVDDLPLKLVAKAYGGTDLRAPFDWIDKQGIDIAVMVYLTDLEGPVPKSAPDYPVIWACTTDHKAPWGELVKLRRE